MKRLLVLGLVIAAFALVLSGAASAFDGVEHGTPAKPSNPPSWGPTWNIEDWKWKS
jgi:hypothetical protein